MECLGSINDPLVDEKIVLAQFNKHDAFSDEVLELSRSFKEVDASLYPKRVDLRELPFCTIDPVTAKDFDDAICYVEETTTLYVAIADVASMLHLLGLSTMKRFIEAFPSIFHTVLSRCCHENSAKRSALCNRTKTDLLMFLR